MVYLPPNTFVLFDRVTSTKPQFTKRWLLHTVNQPTLSGRTAVITEGEGRLFSQTLLPEDARIELVGGPGKDFWVAGKNYPPPKPKEATEAGAWRIEVYPGAPRTQDYFLHVLYAASAGVRSGPKAELIRGQGRFGVEVALKGRTCTVTFATEGDPAGHVTIKDAAGKTLVDQDLTQDIQPQRFMPEQEANR